MRFGKAKVSAEKVAVVHSRIQARGNKKIAPPLFTIILLNLTRNFLTKLVSNFPEIYRYFRQVFFLGLIYFRADFFKKNVDLFFNFF